MTPSQEIEDRLEELKKLIDGPPFWFIGNTRALQNEIFPQLINALEICCSFHRTHQIFDSNSATVLREVAEALRGKPK